MPIDPKPDEAAIEKKVEALKQLKITHNGQEMILSEEQAIELAQKGFNADHQVQRLKDEQKKTREQREEQAAQLQIMERFQGWMTANPDKKDLINQLYKGEITLEQAREHAPDVPSVGMEEGEPTPTRVVAAPNPVSDAVLNRLQRLEDLEVSRADASTKQTFEETLVSAIKNDEFLKKRPDLEGIALTMMREEVTDRSMDLSAARILVSNQLKGIMDGAATKKRDELAARRESTLTIRPAVGDPTLRDHVPDIQKTDTRKEAFVKTKAAAKEWAKSLVRAAGEGPDS